MVVELVAQSPQRRSGRGDGIALLVAEFGERTGEDDVAFLADRTRMRP